MKSEVININEKFKKIDKFWSPRVIEQMNNYQFKLAKFKGEFTWHNHKETDEVFIVIDGKMNIEFRDKVVSLEAGELFVVAKGIEHKPYAENECNVMIIEPAGTVNTGEELSDLTAASDEWI